MSNKLLSSGEVAQLFGVTRKTVTRWADNGKLNAIHTLGGHRRFRREEVEALLEGNNDDEVEEEQEPINPILHTQM